MRTLAKGWELEGWELDENVSPQPAKTSVRQFQLDFWTKFRDKALAVGATSFRTPRPGYGAEIRFGKSGILLHLTRNVAQNFAAIRIYVEPYKVDAYFPVLESIKPELEELAGRTLDWNARAGVKSRIVELERYELNAANPKSVDAVLDKMVDAVRKYRKTLRRAFRAEQNEGKYSLESYSFSEKTRLLYDAFHDALLRRFPDLRREFKKMYVAYKTTTNVVDLIPTKKKLRAIVNLKFSEISDPENICFDLEGKGSWGNGEVEIDLVDVAQIDSALNIVAQSRAKRRT